MNNQSVIGVVNTNKNYSDYHLLLITGLLAGLCISGVFDRPDWYSKSLFALLAVMFLLAIACRFLIGVFFDRRFKDKLLKVSAPDDQFIVTPFKRTKNAKRLQFYRALI